MSRKVRLTAECKNNIRAINGYIAQESPQNARRWRSGLRERFRSLHYLPERHEIAYPASFVGRDVRHTFFGVYRILYAVDGDEVVVLAVRHGAREPLTPDELRRVR